jgi:hypothetical protein
LLRDGSLLALALVVTIAAVWKARSKRQTVDSELKPAATPASS